MRIGVITLIFIVYQFFSELATPIPLFFLELHRMKNLGTVRQHFEYWFVSSNLLMIFLMSFFLDLLVLVFFKSDRLPILFFFVE